MPRRARTRDLPRGVFSCLAAAYLHRPHGRHGRRLGVADRRRDDLGPVRHWLLYLGGLFAGPVSRHRARHDRDRRAWSRIEHPDPRRRASGDAMEIDMSRTPASTSQGHIEVKNFSLAYETIEGAVQAVTDTAIHVKPGEFV